MKVIIHFVKILPVIKKCIKCPLVSVAGVVGHDCGLNVSNGGGGRQFAQRLLNGLPAWLTRARRMRRLHVRQLHMMSIPDMLALSRSDYTLLHPVQIYQHRVAFPQKRGAVHSVVLQSLQVPDGKRGKCGSRL